MKKKIYPIIALSFAIMMSACGGKKAAEPSSVEKEETEKATRETVIIIKITIISSKEVRTNIFV